MERFLAVDFLVENEADDQTDEERTSATVELHADLRHVVILRAAKNHLLFRTRVPPVS